MNKNALQNKRMTLSYAVKETISADLALQDAISRGYANISGVARVIKPEVERKVGSPVKLESLITTLKRTKIDWKVGEDVKRVIAQSTLSVRTGIEKTIVHSSEGNIHRLGQLLANHANSFFGVAIGSLSITMIYEEALSQRVGSTFSDDILSSSKNLAAIVVQSPPEIASTPGCVITLYGQVSRRGINIEETISCYTETMIVVQERDVGKALEALAELISSTKEALSKR
jgi:aspartokinase